MAHLELSTETLESRLLLAGNVRATVTRAGDLLIRGDAQDNEIAIVGGDSADQLLVYGIDTTVNRDAGPFVADGVTRNVRIWMRGGHDRVEVGVSASAQVPPGNPIQLDGLLYVNLGGGHDYANITNADTIGLNGLSEPSGGQLGTVYVRGQGGDDFVSVHDVTMSGDLRVFDTTGDDVVNVAYIDMNGENCEVDIGTCPGQDEICFEGSFEGMDVRVRAGRHTDTLLGYDQLPENAVIKGVEIYGSHGE